jgi:C4-dicarboxylate-specific signal transduction histidine kinase
VGAAVVGVLVLALLQRARTAQATARAREIELQARRQSAELAEQHQREMAQVGRVAVAGELTASLSHELGQPLAAIVNNAEVARRLLARQVAQGATSAPAIEEALLDVVAQGRRASQVVREFRRFLRREHGERELLSVRELVESTTLLLRQEFAYHGVPLHVDIAPETPAITVERVLLQQVVVNLLQNALEAARVVRNGYVLVRARPVAGGVRLSVVDNGAGFAADVRRSAFEPFVTTRASGMGMGLAIARRVVEAHGGRIGVGHLSGAGAVVSLWVPTDTAHADRADRLVPLQVTTHG